MKEAFLHQIWKFRRFSHQTLQLSNGKVLEILNPGWLNHDSGPDFFNGSIRIDGIQWNGNIEIHIKSSDWYAHKHELDKAYDNVILHVVYEHDQEVFLGNEAIPTLELKPILNAHEWSNYMEFVNSNLQIACEKSIKTIDTIYIQQEIQRACVQRLERKAGLLIARLAELENNFQHLLYEQVAKLFGSKVNALPFLELAQRLPSSILLREGLERRAALVLGVAGFLEEEMEEEYPLQLKKEWIFLQQKHGLKSMEKASWKFFGVRPSSYPPFKLVQFACFLDELLLLDVEHKDVDTFIHTMKKAVNKPRKLPDFWKTHYHFEKEGKEHHTKISKSFLDLYYINVICPMLWLKGLLKSHTESQEFALQLLAKTQAENNKITRLYENLGVEVKSSADSQGLLELKHEFCDKKLCLSCAIGIKILQP